jgi:3',5'-cyclic AMP phosphodiesterase CpdA
MGFSADGRKLFLVTWDGPGGTGKGGVSITKEANDMAGLGATTAVNLDGGGSTTMVARALGDTSVTVRNVPSDGQERSDPNGVGIFVKPGDGTVDDLVVTPAGDDATVFPGLHRTLTAKGVDSNQTPVPVARGDVRWSASAGSIDAGQLAAPADATGTITVRSTTDTAQAQTKVSVLHALDALELSTNRLSIADPTPAAATTVKVTGRDDQGYTAPVEFEDLQLDYDENVVKIAPGGTPGSMRITPLANAATLLKITAGAKTITLPITVGVQTVTPYAFDDDVVARWRSNSTTPASTTIEKDPEGLKLTFAAMRNFGITPIAATGRITFPGQPLRVRLKLKSDTAVPAGLTYLGFYDGNGVAKGIYGSAITASDDWQYVTWTLPAGTAYPITVSSFQGILTNVAQQKAGRFIIGSYEADVPTSIDLPAPDPLRADPLISPDGALPSGGKDWNFATLSDVQFTADSPALTKVAVAAIERIKATKPDLLVLNGDITDRGLPQDLTLARQTLESAGCDIIPVGSEPAPDSTPDSSTGKLPCYYVPGNHESYGLNNVQLDLTNFTAEFGQPYRTFDHKGTRFILLASSLGSLRSSNWDQLPMLQSALESAKADPSIDNVMVFAHHPVDDPAETKSSQLTDRTEVALIEKLLGDFRDASGKGAAMVGSHAQMANVHRIDGVPYTVLPSSGKDPYGTPTTGGFTGWLRWAVDPTKDAGQQWLTADVNAFAQSITLDAPASVEVSRSAPLSGSIVQPAGVATGTRVVPLAYPMSVHWSGSANLAIGSGSAAIDAARAAGKSAILDPRTRQLTGLRTGSVTITVTNESMREYTDAASLAPITTQQTVDVVAYSGPGPRLDVATPVFPSQPVGTIGPGQAIAVTNGGDAPLVISDAAIRPVTGSPAGEFLLADNGCKDATVAPGATCTVLVRFAPSVVDVTRKAELVLSANTADPQTVVALSGLSIPLPPGAPGGDGPAGPQGPTGPAGPTGPSGSDGADGADGQDGAAGPTGLAGADGADGATGAKGATGATGSGGPAGPTGATGAKGDTGATGATGAQGPAGPVTVSAGSSDAGTGTTTKTPTIRVDSKGRIVVSLRNADDKALKVRVRARATIGGKQVTLSTRVITLRAGRSTKVALAIDAKLRKRLGHTTHPLAITATPLSGSERGTTLQAKIG